MKEAQRILHWKASQQKGNCTDQNPDGESRHRQLASWRSWTETLLTLVTEKKLHWSEHWWENRHRQYASWTENCQRKETARIKPFLIEVIMQKRKSTKQKWQHWWEWEHPWKASFWSVQKLLMTENSTSGIQNTQNVSHTPNSINGRRNTCPNENSYKSWKYNHSQNVPCAVNTNKKISTDHQAGRDARASLDSIHNVQTNLIAQKNLDQAVWEEGLAQKSAIFCIQSKVKKQKTKKQSNHK